MSISLNEQSVVVLPGFRFHPTEEELLTYYLTKKVASQPIDLGVIPDVDLNKLEPWDIQERCRIGAGPQNDWYLFSHKDKKYPTGMRTNRATAAGFWKATGRDRVIYSAAGSGRIGKRKTLVFYEGRAPHGHKSDWIMHEYRLDDVVNNPAAYYSSASSPIRCVARDYDEGWVVCKVFKKKHRVVQHQAVQSTGSAAVGKLTGAAAMERSPSNCSSTVTVSDHVKSQMQQQLLHYSASSDDALDHILSSTTSCKQQTKPTNPSSALDHLINKACPNGSTLYDKFIELQPLEHVVAGRLLPKLTDDWDKLDRIAAYKLNDLSDAASTKTNGMSFFVDEHSCATAISGGTCAGDGDLWSLVRSVSSLHADLTINNV